MGKSTERREGIRAKRRMEWQARLSRASYTNWQAKKTVPACLKPSAPVFPTRWLRVMPVGEVVVYALAVGDL